MQKALQEWSNHTKERRVKNKIYGTSIETKFMNRTLMYKIVSKQIKAHIENDGKLINK